MCASKKDLQVATLSMRESLIPVVDKGQSLMSEKLPNHFLSFNS